ncbi:MAG: FAD-dependent oxidoreductase, partial [Gammaproteobacteria bacterium]|nr:FAD-dependent oxidoreductase [Gammaproteobacteria bacterium]
MKGTRSPRARKPLRRSNPDRFDVIVIGAGSAGLPLAIRAAERGARVLQLEADYRIGGTLHWSSGQISAAGTRLQHSQGIEDSP